ncbi:MAG: hypothetical protein JKY56_01115 [Kofleriaceae bacterium]|nr:hypothetical protein [Kofleriaceae bacterium]
MRTLTTTLRNQYSFGLEGFEWTCNYQNTTDSVLRFGIKATDEMCILFGQIYDPVTLMPANQRCN